MSNHSVIEHKASYHFIRVEEDFIAICTAGLQAAHCKAMILAVLESWANTKRAKGEGPYVYMTYEQWVISLYSFYKRNVIINCLNELKGQGLIKSRQIKVSGKLTYEYCIDVEEVNRRIAALSEKAPGETLPQLDWDALKNKRIEKSTHPKINGSGVEKSMRDASKNKRILTSEAKPPDLTSEEESTPALTFTPEEQKWFDTIFCACKRLVPAHPPKIKPSLKDAIAVLSQHIATLGELESLFDWTSARPWLKGKEIYPGNLVDCLNAWYQTRPPPTSTSSTGYRPQNGVQLIGNKPAAEWTEEEIAALPDAFERKALRAARRPAQLVGVGVGGP